MFEHKGMTAGEAKRREHPGEAKPSGDKTRPSDQEEHGEDSNGDGIHHHEMHGPHEDGSYTSKHTHPDGHVEEGMHGDYSEARDHMDAMHGEDGKDGEEEYSHSEPDGDEPEDIAGMYSGE
jgi:hypothetical protein